MLMLKPTSLIIVSKLSIASLISTSAVAGSYLNGYMSGLQFTLTDLDPSDGIAPSIGFDTASASLFTVGSLEGTTSDYGT